MELVRNGTMVLDLVKQLVSYILHFVITEMFNLHFICSLINWQFDVYLIIAVIKRLIAIPMCTFAVKLSDVKKTDFLLHYYRRKWTNCFSETTKDYFSKSCVFRIKCKCADVYNLLPWNLSEKYALKSFSGRLLLGR